jgi:hypothetical protein
MACAARIFGTDGKEIFDVETWLAHAPPEGGEAQWRDGYSAKEQAKAWLRPDGAPALPDELDDALTGLGLGAFNEVYARPEHQTKLDHYGRRRQHDVFACARLDGSTQFVVGIEAKACEGFDGTVAARASAEPPSNKRARSNLMARALFGRPVIDEQNGAILDEDLSRHGYQLWSAAVGTLIEAQERGQTNAVVVVHQFAPPDPENVAGDDKRNWPKALATNGAMFDAFARALEAGGGVSHETEFVEPGIRLHAVKARGLIGTPLSEAGS